MNLPNAIIFVNNDLTPGVQGPLVRQLYISEVITGEEFDLRVEADPNYPLIVHQNDMRLLVIRDFADGYNRELADVAIFVKAGLAAIEDNKYGPHGVTMAVDTINIYKLLKDYPIAGTISVPSDVQDNIFLTLFPNKNKPDLYPFGSASSRTTGGKGALIDDED